MSGSVTLEIVTGTDWATQITWTDGNSAGVPFNLPAMEIRQDLNPNSNLLVRLDTLGGAGSIQITAPGTMLLTIPASVTKTLQPGTAFWDLYLTTSSLQRARLLFGTVAIKPHVTASA